MIIVSQGKNAIYNFNNTNCIYIRKAEGEYRIILFDNTYSMENDGDCIGIYKTEERAKTVLQEIIQKYLSYLEIKGGIGLMKGSMNVQPNIFNIPKVYGMPEE